MMRAFRQFGLLILALIVLGMCPGLALAQDEGYRFSSLTVSSGDNPIASGITGVADFTNGRNHLIGVAVQQEQAWLLYGRNFGTSVTGTVAGSVGHFQGAPWVGPFLSLNVPLARIAGQQVAVSTLQWPGFQFWEPKDWKNDGKPNPEALNVGYLGSVGLSVGPVTLSYSALNFLDDPWNELPGISYTQKVQKEFHTTVSGTWNNNKKEWMFYIGLTWKPEHNPVQVTAKNP